MTSTEVLSMYEHVAGLTSKMVLAANSGDWDGLGKLENQCAFQARRVEDGVVPALSGAPRMRKIDLLKQILANDRQIRAITEPWIDQVSNLMQGAASKYAPANCTVS